MSQQFEHPGAALTPDVITANILQLGRGLPEAAVVVGSSALALTIDTSRNPHDIDLAVPDDAFAYLRSSQGWTETQQPDGSPRLTNGIFDVGTGWSDVTHSELKERSWTSPEGLVVAGLPDISAYKQARHSEKDQQDLEALRARLHNPQLPPLSSRVMAHEVKAVRACLPEAVQDDPEAQTALLLAASGLHTIYTLFGHPGIRRVGQIVGSLELAEYGVPAAYHNGFGVVQDLRQLQNHLTNIGASPQDRLVALAADASSDAVYGNGRFSDNPEGHDELLAANLLRERALLLGCDEYTASRMHAAILGTTFDEKTKAQRGKRSSDPVVRAVAGIDLQTLAEPDSVEQTLALAVEDGFSARYSRERVIGRVMLEHNVRVDSVVTALQAIDGLADVRPSDAPNGSTVMQFFAGRLASNAGFQIGHEYPEGWTLDSPALRADHAAKLRKLGEKLATGRISAVDAHELAQEHTIATAKKYARV